MSFSVVPENVLVDILCLLDAEDRKCASMVNWSWRRAFFRKASIRECTLVVESVRQSDRMSFNLLRHVRHLRVKNPVSEVTFRRVVVSEFAFYETLFTVVPFCSMLESIEFKKCEVEMSERRVHASKYLRAVEPARRNLRKVKRIVVTRLNILTDGFQLLLRACVRLQTLQVDSQTNLALSKVLPTLGQQMQVLSLPADADNWLQEMEQHAELAARGVSLHEAHFHYVVVDEDAPDADEVVRALRAVQLRHPKVCLRVAFHVDHLLQAQEEFARLLGDARGGGVRLSALALAFTHRDEHGWQHSRAILPCVFDALPFDTLDTLALELANSRGALRRTLERSRKTAWPLRRLLADLTDDVLRCTAFFPHLRVLELTASSGWSHSFRLETLARNCRALQRLKLLNAADNATACVLFSNVSARARFDRLKALAIDGWYLERRETFRIIAPSLRKLELKFRASPCANEKDCRAGHSMACRLPDEVFESRLWRQVVAACPRLTRIRTVLSPAQFVPFLRTVASLKQLRALDVECNYLELLGALGVLDALAACSALRRVKLVHYSNVSALRRLEADLTNVHFEVLPSFR